MGRIAMPDRARGRPKASTLIAPTGASNRASRSAMGVATAVANKDSDDTVGRSSGGSR